MKLIRLHVENFGKLQNFSYSFNGELNTILEENGWGKSTLAAFIKAMLYGMPASSKQSLDENERKKYMPWQGGAYGGSLELAVSTGKYRIERFFGVKESGDSFALYDLATNCESHRYSSRIGEELFGIDADGFARTVYLSQHAIVAKGDNNSITAKLGDLLDDVDDIGSFDDAMAALDQRRKYYKMTGERGRIADIERVHKSSNLLAPRKHCAKRKPNSLPWAKSSKNQLHLSKKCVLLCVAQEPCVREPF